MSREIKFRAWDGEKMHFNSERDEYDYYLTMDLNGEFFPHDRPNDSYFIAEESKWNKKKWTLMQYTGLKDKNGVEIYEGDIVKAYSEGACRNLEVRWRQEGAPPCYILYPAWKDGVTWNLYGSRNNKGDCIDPCEVIGNIYQNPELLES